VKLKFSISIMATVAVIGAGISGLSAAYYLSKASHLKVNSVSDFYFDMFSVKFIARLTAVRPLRVTG